MSDGGLAAASGVLVFSAPALVRRDLCLIRTVARRLRRMRSRVAVVLVLVLSQLGQQRVAAADEPPTETRSRIRLHVEPSVFAGQLFVRVPMYLPSGTSSTLVVSGFAALRVAVGVRLMLPRCLELRFGPTLEYFEGANYSTVGLELQLDGWARAGLRVGGRAGYSDASLGNTILIFGPRARLGRWTFGADFVSASELDLQRKGWALSAGVDGGTSKWMIAATAAFGVLFLLTQ